MRRKILAQPQRLWQAIVPKQIFCVMVQQSLRGKLLARIVYQVHGLVSKPA